MNIAQWAGMCRSLSTCWPRAIDRRSWNPQGLRHPLGVLYKISLHSLLSDCGAGYVKRKPGFVLRNPIGFWFNKVLHLHLSGILIWRGDPGNTSKWEKVKAKSLYVSYKIQSGQSSCRDVWELPEERWGHMFSLLLSGRHPTQMQNLCFRGSQNSEVHLVVHLGLQSMWCPDSYSVDSCCLLSTACFTLDISCQCAFFISVSFIMAILVNIGLNQEIGFSHCCSLQITS